MAQYTEHFNLVKLDPGEGIHDAGDRFATADRERIDQIIHAAVHHHHTGGAAVDSDLPAPELTLVEGDGSFPAETTIRYRYSVVSPITGETSASPEATITTPAPLKAPVAPGYNIQSIGGSLEAGSYYYVLTHYQGSSLTETKALNAVNVVIPSGTSNQVELDLPELLPGASGFNVYRRSPGQTRYYHLGSISDESFIDDGIEVVVSRTIPSKNTTNTSYSIVVDLPNADFGSAEQWRLYRALDVTFTNSFLSQQELSVDSVTDVGEATGTASPLADDIAVPSPSKVLLTDGAEVTGELPDDMVAVDDSAFNELQGATLAEILAHIDQQGAGGGATDLSWDPSTSTVVSNTGLDAELTMVDSQNAGLMSVADKEALDSAVQPEDLATVAVTGSYNDLSDRPIGGDGGGGGDPLTIAGNVVKLVYLTTAVSEVSSDGWYLPDGTVPTLSNRTASVIWEGTSAQIPAQGTDATSFRVGDNAIVRAASL